MYNGESVELIWSNRRGGVVDSTNAEGNLKLFGNSSEPEGPRFLINAGKKNRPSLLRNQP